MPTQLTIEANLILENSYLQLVLSTDYEQK